MSVTPAYTLVGDLKGYSRLDNPQISALFNEFYPRLGKVIDGYRQNLTEVNTWGDALFVVGTSVEEMAELAFAIRDETKNFNWEKHKIPPLDLRLSMHLGEVTRADNPITRRPGVFGKSIILASRLEPVTEPGRIWVTNAFKNAIDDACRGSHCFAVCDEIGKLVLSKGYGEEHVWMLRRPREPALTDDQRRSTLLQFEMREQSPAKEASGVEKITIGVVWRKQSKKKQVLLVKRRKNDEALEWMFPSGRAYVNEELKTRVWRVVKSETGLMCTVVSDLGFRLAPRNEKQELHYFELKPVGNKTKAHNADSFENEDVQWIDVDAAIDLIGDRLFPKVREFLGGF